MQTDTMNEALKLAPPVTVITTGWAGLVDWSSFSYAMTGFYMLLLSIGAIYKGYKYIQGLRAKPGAP